MQGPQKIEAVTQRSDDPYAEIESDGLAGARFFQRDEKGYERVIFAEIIIPNALNVYGDFHTPESVKEYAYGFMIGGFGIDINHDEIHQDSLTVVESFIARNGDPDFIPGAWVIGMHIGDDDIWEQVVNGDLNGFSYQALANVIDVNMEVPVQVTRSGETQPNLVDSHTHSFFVILDDDGRVIVGGTSEDQGHSHTIRSHTFTDKTDGHSHIYNFVKGEGGI